VNKYSLNRTSYSQSYQIRSSPKAMS
jgi:hypothetical protein